MKGRARTGLLSAILCIVVVSSAITILNLYRTNTQLKAAIPYLLPGEKPHYFHISDRKNEIFTRLPQNRPVFIFIFSRPCSACEKNVYFWNKIIDLTTNKFMAMGIILDIRDFELIFEKSRTFKFRIYVPENIEIISFPHFA